MKRVLLVLAAAAVIAALSCAAAAAQGEAVAVNSGELLQNWQEYDGREVLYKGEVVGDVMLRGDYAWITVNDDHYSRQALKEAGELRGGNSGLGIWLPAEEAEKIKVVGRYGTVGDFVEIRGVFFADDPQHGGDVDIQATSLDVLEPGRHIDTSPDTGKYLAAIFAFLFLAGSMTPFFRRRAMEMRSARALLEEEED